MSCIDLNTEDLLTIDGFQTLEGPPLGSGEEELCTMEIIDDVYRKSGLGIRCPTD